MTRRAYLVERTAIDSGAIVGGLTVDQRQTFSLRDAGVTDVVAVHPDDVAPPGTGSAIVAVAGSIWHPASLRRLARTAVAADEVVAMGAAEAGVYKCGSARVADTVAGVARGQPVRAERILELVEPEFVVLPRTAPDRLAAEQLLLRSLEKPTDGIVSRRLHRPLSRAVTRRLLRWPVTPNAITLVAAVFGAVGALVAWPGGYANVLAGAVLFELQNVLDGCDGEIARLKHLRSRAGEWLDQVVDDVLNVAFLSAVGIALSREYGWARPLVVAAIVAQIVHVTGLYAGLIVKAGGRGSVALLRWRVDGGGSGSRIFGDLTRRDFLSFLYVVTAAADAVAVAFVWHALVTFGSAAVTTLEWVVWNGPHAHAETDGATDPAGEAAA